MNKLFAALLIAALAPVAAVAQTGVVADGKTVWEGPTQCRNCHGKAGEGGFGPDLAGRGLSVAEFSQAVRKPWGVMPRFAPKMYCACAMWRNTSAIDRTPGAGRHVYLSWGIASASWMIFRFT